MKNVKMSKMSAAEAAEKETQMDFDALFDAAIRRLVATGRVRVSDRDGEVVYTLSEAAVDELEGLITDYSLPVGAA